MTRIAIIPGDGIGPEVIGAALPVLQRCAEVFDLDLELQQWDLGAERYLRDGITITEEEFRSLAEEHDAILLGAFGDPRVPSDIHTREILLGLRFRLDLYVNFRPCRLLDPALSPLRNAGPTTDVEIFRENTEGAYANLGGLFKAGTSDEVAILGDINTRKGVERVIRAAFEYARDRDRRLVTLVDKANAMPTVGSLWRRTFDEVRQDFGGIDSNAMYVDAMAMDLVRRPERYSVVVTSNLFGDIISDLAAEITGGLGLAPSANVHPDGHALFEPVHGSAPDIAGTGIANPIAAVRCVGLLLGHLGYDDAAARVDEAVDRSLREGVRTPDIGGRCSTAEVGDWIAGAVGSVGA